MARGGMTGQGGPRNPNRVTSRPTAVPASVSGPAPTNPRQTPFTGTHPAVMQEIVAVADWTYTSRNPLIRFRREYFWEDIALLVKRCTGLTLGMHKNYRLVK